MADHYDNGGSGNRTAVTIAAIVGGVIVVFLLVCGGVVYLGIKALEGMKEAFQPMMEGIREIAESQGVADEFVENIRTNRLDAAYQSTTESFKKGMSRKEFDELVQKHPELKQPASSQDFDPRQGQGQPQGQPQIKAFSGPYRYRFSVQAKDDKQSGEFTVTVAKENGVLKVDQLTLYKKEGSK